MALMLSGVSPIELRLNVCSAKTRSTDQNMDKDDFPNILLCPFSHFQSIIITHCAAISQATCTLNVCVVLSLGIYYIDF